MKKLGTTLILALSLLSITACGKKKENNNLANYNCNGVYQTTQCAYGQYPGQQYGQYGQYGQYPGQQYGGQMCQAGSVQTQMYGCLQQGPCATLGPNYGYHPTALNGGPGCVMGTSPYGGYQQPYQQYGGGGYYGGTYGGQTGW